MELLTQGLYPRIGSVYVMSWEPVQMIGSYHSPWAGMGVGSSSRHESVTWYFVVPGVGFELQHRGFRLVSPGAAQRP
jgi:hypothetical protein